MLLHLVILISNKHILILCNLQRLLNVNLRVEIYSTRFESGELPSNAWTSLILLYAGFISAAWTQLIGSHFTTQNLELCYSSGNSLNMGCPMLRFRCMNRPGVLICPITAVAWDCRLLRKSSPERSSRISASLSGLRHNNLETLLPCPSLRTAHRTMCYLCCTAA